MKKVTCSRCGARFEPQAGKCPSCGARYRAATTAQKKTAATRGDVRARAAFPARREKRSPAFGFIVAAVAVLAVLTVVLCSLGGVFDFVSSAAPKMPNVVGQTESNARLMLEGMNLRVEIRTDESAEAAGVVIEQSVPAGRALKANQNVTLTLSDGSRAERVDVGAAPSETVEAPFVQGEDFEVARMRTEAQGLFLTYGGEQYSNAPEGTILTQEPVAGTRVKPGSAILVTISLGPETVEHTISVTAGKGGRVSPSGRVTVEEGERVVFEIIPDAGYVVSEVKIDGEDVGAVKTYTFENVEDDHMLYAVFRVGTEADAPAREDTPPVVSTPSDIPKNR